MNDNMLSEFLFRSRKLYRRKPDIKIIIITFNGKGGSVPLMLWLKLAGLSIYSRASSEDTRCPPAASDAPPVNSEPTMPNIPSQMDSSCPAR